jgi:hypothetical protein
MYFILVEYYTITHVPTFRNNFYQRRTHHNAILAETILQYIHSFDHRDIISTRIPCISIFTSKLLHVCTYINAFWVLIQSTECYFLFLSFQFMDHIFINRPVNVYFLLLECLSCQIREKSCDIDTKHDGWMEKGKEISINFSFTLLFIRNVKMKA